MPTHAAIDWYDTPRYYDAVFSTDDDAEARFLEALWRRHGLGPRSRARPAALEPACGSGRLLLALADRGFDVTGFDASEPMLDYARERLAGAGRRARLLRARLEDFDVAEIGRERFDLAHCLVNTFKYLLDETSAREHLGRVARALRPGGLYAVGINLTDYRDRRCNHERWVVRRRGLAVVCNIRGWPADRGTRHEQVRSRLRVVERGEERRTETRWTFRTYDLRQFRSLVASVPRLEHVATYGFDYDLDAPVDPEGDRLDLVLVLRKRHG
jgi:SAM-dependent methyltransferase